MPYTFNPFTGKLDYYKEPTSGSGDVATDPIWTTKGDIAVATGDDAAQVLGVGSNGQVLTADSTQTTGVKWETVSGTGDVTSASNLTDNAIVRGDGGAKGVQTSGVTIDDSDNISGFNSVGDATVSDLEKLHDITASASELNILDGATLDTTELNYVDGVTSAIQTQINEKQPIIRKGTCTTAGATTSKTVTLDSPWSSYTPVTGDMFAITYTNTITSTPITLNINSSGAVNVRISGTTSSGMQAVSGGTQIYYYDGSVYCLTGTITPGEISEENIINTSSGSSGLITGRRAEYLMANEATKPRTLTNKTIDANGTGNSITNLEVADFASGVIDTDISSTSGSDDTLPSAKAAKTYVDNTVAKYASVGQLLNGVITPSVSSNNLTVAIKTVAGGDPSTSDPVYCRIGNAVRSITSALSITRNAGTNWFASGASKLATNEIDYFVYLAWDSSNSSVRVGFARIPYARLYSDFNSTNTNERHGAFDTAPGSADTVTVIGRFAATLSATSAFNWSVPTFTSVNLIQSPIYQGRLLDWVPSYSATGSMGTTLELLTGARYQVDGEYCFAQWQFRLNLTGTPSNEIYHTAPFSSLNSLREYNTGENPGATTGTVRIWSSLSDKFGTLKLDSSNYTIASGQNFLGSIRYRIK